MESDEDPYQTDEDDDYDPGSEMSNSDGANSNEASDIPHVTPAKTRKRQRHEVEWKVNKKKRLRTQGKEYVHNKKFHRSKRLEVYDHMCRYKCNQNISEAQRKELFDTYYNLPTYDLQTAFLSSCIKKGEVERKKTNTRANRKFSTQIKLINKRVCKAFFLKTFDITNRRFTSVCLKTNHLGATEPDKRGKGQSNKKMNNDMRNFVIQHIKKFPRYRSHYSRKENSETRYLSPDLNVKKMYELYKEVCQEEQKPPVKLSYYRFIFNNEFNLRFHRPHSDTCSKCDSYHNIIKYSHDESKIAETKVQLEVHQRKAEKAVSSKKMDIETSKSSTDTIVICFDLQQALPTPLLTTSKVFYLRQLWTYNFCVYDLLSGKAHMFIWSENVASRRSVEIGSCLLKFVKSLPPNIKKIVAYSDSCGGQNKNKNICKLFMFLVKATQLEEIHHKYLEPGHTYMECDRSFGNIEKCKKRIPQIFVPQHWSSLIKNASKNFLVHDMTKECFFSFSHLNSLIPDPKKDTTKQCLKFNSIVYFKYTKNAETYSFEFKSTLEKDFPFLKCISAPTTGRPSTNLNMVFSKLSNNSPLKISAEKWNNLQTLLEYIPPTYHNYYTKMAHQPKAAKKKKNKKEENIPTASTSHTENHEDSGQNSTVEDDMLLDSDYEI